MNTQRDDFSIAWGGIDDDVVTIDTENPPSHDGQKGSKEKAGVLFEKKREDQGTYYFEEEVTPRTESASLSSMKPKSSNRISKSDVDEDTDENHAMSSGQNYGPSAACCQIYCFGRRVSSCFCCTLVVFVLLAVAGAAFGGSVLAYYSTQVWKWP